MTKEAIIVGILFGVLMSWKGKTFLSEPRFKNLIIAGVGAAIFLIALKIAAFVPFVIHRFSIIHVFALFMMAIGCLIGRHLGYVLGGVGLLLNAIVVAANGYMPVEVSAILKIGDEKALTRLSEGRLLTHGLANVGTHLRFLCDRFVFSSALTSPRVISLGDVFIAFGLFLFVASATSYVFRKADHHEMD